MSDLDSFLSELASEGDVLEGGGGFTLRSDKAREKLKKFALAHPEGYFLLVIAALHAFGGRDFELNVDADDMILTADCTVSRESLTHLWEHVAGGGTDSGRVGLRLLGLAMLTSTRFEKVDWKVQCGEYELQQKVQAGGISDPSLVISGVSIEGTRVWAKRKDLRTVASRFFQQLSRRAFQTAWEEEFKVAQRVFPGALRSFRFNGRELDFGATQRQALALLKIGQVPGFVSARYETQLEGERAMMVVVGRSEALSGSAKNISWIWHGLEMGETRIGLRYDFLRVYMVADGLRCDLSLTAVADTWERQAVVREARDAARTALEHLAERFSEEQRGLLDSVDPEAEDILLEVASERIDVQRSRHRLASFNSALVEAPLFIWSTEDGKRNRATIGQIWELIEKGKHPALYQDPESWVDTPAWPDRPAIIFARKTQSDALRKIFGAAAFHDGRKVVESLTARAADAARQAFVPPRSSDWSGKVEVRGVQLDWHLTFNEQMMGRFKAISENEVLFEDTSLDLPRGFLFYGKVPWAPDYSGRLTDPRVRDALEETACRVLVDHLHRKQSAADKYDLAAQGIVLRGLREKEELWTSPHLANQSWLSVQTESGGSVWVSPQQFRDEMSGRDGAGYFTVAEPLREPSVPPEGMAWPSPLVVMPSSLEHLPPDLHDIRGITRLAQRPAFEFPDRGYRVVLIDRGRLKCHRDIESLRVGFPDRRQVPSGVNVSVETNLHGHRMKSKNLSSFVGPVTVQVCFRRGWPDSDGCHFVDKETTESVKQMMPELLNLASRILITESSHSEIEQLHPDVQRTTMVDLWTEVHWEWDGSLPILSGGRTPIARLREQKEIRYTTESSALLPGDTLLLTEYQAEALKMVADEIRWVKLSPTPERVEVETPSEVSPEVAEVKSKPSEKKVRRKPLEKKERPELDPETSADLAPEVKAVPQEPFLVSLLDILEKVIAGEELAHSEEFRNYLQQVRVKDDLDSVLSVDSDGVWVRPVKNLQQERLIAILSALYSAFNRGQAEVSDSDERVFHARILEYASSGIYGGVKGASP